jgi:arylsulfatase A-like enzyme
MTKARSAALVVVAGLSVIGAATAAPAGSAVAGATRAYTSFTVPQRVPPSPTGEPAISSTGSVLGRPAPKPRVRPPDRPNVVMITADDMSVQDLPYMPHVRRLLIRQGTVMTNAIAPTSLCVPARASLLTGQFATNHGSYSIDGPHGGFASLPEGNTLPVWLHAVSYHTYFAGKYLNGYGVDDPTYVPPGWTDWRATVDWSTYDYLRPTVNHNGRLHSHHHYSTDVIRRQSMAQLQQAGSRKPFFMWINYVAPHNGGPREDDDPMRTEADPRFRIPTTVPAPRDKGTFAGVQLPSNPAMFESDTSDKPAASPTHREWGPHAREVLRTVYQQRLEALQDVDRSVAATVSRLRRMGELDDTLIVFGSDNGYVTGEHNLNTKLWEYDDILRIPMVLRGPGVPRGKVTTTPVSNPDIATTIARLARARPGRVQDGVDIIPWLHTGDRVRVVPIIAWPVKDGGRPPLYSGVRVGTWTYVRYHAGGEELYDRSIDPWELDNLASVPRFAPQLQQLRHLAHRYVWCKGDTCPRRFYFPPRHR